MRLEESRYPKDWFRIGDKELKRAKNLLSLEDLEGAGFNIQQARIHNLETLINEAIRYEPSFEEFRAACQKISRYYVRERYPFAVPSELTEDEIRVSLTVAENIIAKIIKGLVE